MRGKLANCSRSTRATSPEAPVRGKDTGGPEG